mmetsp:Transcript_51274/g.116860  ORF Transcript_51274/g.116860 Transcript_51274/m.116860 type:complete len:119 (-) Transcript_51274:66-422(-)
MARARAAVAAVAVSASSADPWTIGLGSARRVAVAREACATTGGTMVSAPMVTGVGSPMTDFKVACIGLVIRGLNFSGCVVGAAAARSRWVCRVPFPAGQTVVWAGSGGKTGLQIGQRE